MEDLASVSTANRSMHVRIVVDLVSVSTVSPNFAVSTVEGLVFVQQLGSAAQSQLVSRAGIRAEPALQQQFESMAQSQFLLAIPCADPQTS